MTRAVTVVNTSNWDGEEWALTVEGVAYDIDDQKLRLAPGDSITLHASAEEMTVKVRKLERRDPTPFMAGSTQLIPEVDVHLKATHGDHRIPISVWRNGGQKR